MIIKGMTYLKWLLRVTTYLFSSSRPDSSAPSLIKTLYKLQNTLIYLSSRNRDRKRQKQSWNLRNNWLKVIYKYQKKKKTW